MEPGQPSRAVAAPPRFTAWMAPLRHRNFRLFFIGQVISQIGSWMQTVAQSWLVLELTRSPFLLGVVNALQWTPALLFSLPAGVVIDRVPKRTLVIVTQSVFLVLALCLGVLAVSGRVQFWHVAVLATLFGVVNSLDVPARQAFTIEMIAGPEDLTGAIALNSATFNGARLIGPTVAGLVIAAWGAGVAFMVNAASFLAVIAALAMMRIAPRALVVISGPLTAHIGEAVTFVRRSRRVLGALVALAFLGTFPMNYFVFVPVLAHNTLGLGASGFGFLMGAQGSGALAGALWIATQGPTARTRTLLFRGGFVLCLATIALSTARAAIPAAAFLVIAGAANIMFTSSANSIVQLETPDALRGRVMSIYSLVFNGATPFGALLMGSLIGTWGLSTTLLFAGMVGLVSLLGIVGVAHRTRRARLPAS